MYKFYYKRKSNGANVVSHRELNDDDLVLTSRILDTAMTAKDIKNTAIKKAQIFDKPETLNIKRKEDKSKTNKKSGKK